MKYILIIHICMWAQCENYMITDPVFDTKAECRAYSEYVVDQARTQLPESEGTTYCVTEDEAFDIYNSLQAGEEVNI